MNTHTYGTTSAGHQELKDPALSADGRDWLTFALDPFHDTPTRIAGLPDEDTSATICQVIKKTVQISAPPGTVGNWSFSCFTSNIMNKQSFLPAARIAGAYSQSQIVGPSPVTEVTAVSYADVNEAITTATSMDLGTVNVWSWDDDRGSSAKPFFPNGIPITGQFVQPSVVQSLDCQPNSLQAASKVRVIGMGFELHNTTAELYKQGTFTVSRAPQSSRDTSVLSYRELNITGANARIVGTTNPKMNTFLTDGFARKHVAPPSTLEDALSYVGTVQYEAAEGAYVTCVMDADRCPLQYGSVVPREIGSCQIYSDPNGSFLVETCVATCDRLFRQDDRTYFNNSGAYNCENNFHISTVMATGLSAQSTFTLEFKVLVEVAPHLNDPVYGPLAWSCSPSAAHDARALAIYQAVAPRIPPGVKVSMNADGDFWNTIRSAIADVVPYISEGLSLVLPGAAGRIVGGAVGALGSAIRPKAQQAQPVQAQRKAVVAPKTSKATALRLNMAKAKVRPAPKR